MKMIRVIGRYIMRLISAMGAIIPAASALQSVQLKAAAPGTEINFGSIREITAFNDSGPTKTLADKWHSYIRDGTDRKTAAPYITTDQRRVIIDTGYK